MTLCKPGDDERIMRNGVVSCRLRDRIRAESMQSLLAGRVWTLSNEQGNGHEQHIQHTIQGTAIPGFSDVNQVGKVWVDYVRMPNAYAEQVYKSLQKALVEMHRIGALTSCVQIVFANQRGKSIEEQFLPEFLEVFQHRVVAATEYSLYWCTELYLSELERLDIIVSPNHHRDLMNSCCASYPFVEFILRQ